MRQLDAAIADNRAAVEEFVDAARRIDADRWSLPRAARAWSPAQIAEHLTVAYEYGRRVAAGTAGKGAPRLLRPFARWLIVDRTIEAGRFRQKARAPRILHPSASPGPAPALLARLAMSAGAFESDIRARLQAGGHTLVHPFFGAIDAIDYLRLAAIHTRHHRAQLPSA